MTTFDLNNNFTFNLVDGTNEKKLSGTFRELTKREQLDFKRKNEAIETTIKQGIALAEKIKRNNRMIDIKEKTEDWKAIEKLITETNKLEDEIQKLSESFSPDEERNNILKERFELCLGGADKDEIMHLAETHGYETVFGVIGDAIREGKLSK